MQILEFIYPTLLLLLQIGITACTSEREQPVVPSGKTVRIGVIAPASGPDDDLGNGGLSGVKLAVQVQPYLRNGDKVEIIIEDDESKPDVGLEKAKKLVKQDKVAAILLLSRSHTALKIAESVDDIKTPILATVSTHPLITRNEWISQLVFDDESQGLIAALYVMDELLQQEATIFEDPNDPHSVFLADEFGLKFKEAGGDIRVIDVTGDASAVENEISGLGKEFQQFFYMPVSAAHVLKIEKVIRKFGLDPQILVSDGVASGVVLGFEDDIRLLDGMHAIDVYATAPAKTGYGRRMVDVFKKRFNQPGTTYAALGCEGASLLLSAIEKCDVSSDKECIRKQLRSGEEFIGFSGGIRINSKGKVERPVHVNRIEKGEMKSLLKIY